MVGVLVVLRAARNEPNLRILQCSMTEPKRTGPPTLSAGARAALAWAHGARFLTTASQLDQLPQGDLPEIAFVGRSNAGKSTAINALAQRRQLAFASKTPGRTQHINLFALGPKDEPDSYLADLPGYGYASVERSAKLRWQQVMADYLELRRNLGGVVLMVDSRLGFTPLDQQLLSFIAPRVGEDGRIWNVGSLGSRVILYRLSKNGKLEQARIQPLGQPGYYHDFLLTSRSLVVIQCLTQSDATRNPGTWHWPASPIAPPLSSPA